MKEDEILWPAAEYKYTLMTHHKVTLEVKLPTNRAAKEIKRKANVVVFNLDTDEQYKAIVNRVNRERKLNIIKIQVDIFK